MKYLSAYIIVITILLVLINVVMVSAAENITNNSNNDNSDNSIKSTVRGAGPSGTVGGDGFVYNDMDIHSDAFSVSDAELNQTIESNAEYMIIKGEYINSDVYENVGVTYVNMSTGSFNNMGNLNNFNAHVTFHP